MPSPSAAPRTGNGERIYLGKTVLDAGLERIERIFHEFPNVIVNVSGGKDSTVVLHLALQVAEALGRLPLPVFWIDQEAEWGATVELVDGWMTRDDVEPVWLQVPFNLGSATSPQAQWFRAWDPGRKADWIHPQHPLAIRENTFGTERFTELFDRYLRSRFPDEPAALLTGVRAEESPSRAKGLTHYATYKDITWGRKGDVKRGHYSFHPLYDWTYRDIWKAIHDHGWDYNRIYDLQYRHGSSIQNMRISALIHETAVTNLFDLQEFEPDTYERLILRVPGSDAAAKFGKDDFAVTELPSMFRDWKEYRDYLLEHLTSAEARANLSKIFADHDRKAPEDDPDFLRKMWQVHTSSVLAGDVEGTKTQVWAHGQETYHRFRDNRANWRDRA